MAPKLYMQGCSPEHLDDGGSEQKATWTSELKELAGMVAQENQQPLLWGRSTTLELLYV